MAHEMMITKNYPWTSRRSNIPKNKKVRGVIMTNTQTGEITKYNSMIDCDNENEFPRGTTWHTLSDRGGFYLNYYIQEANPNEKDPD